MLSLQKEAHAFRLELVLEAIRDLLGQALLELQVASEIVDNASELRKPEDPVGRQVGNVGDATDGERLGTASGLRGWRCTVTPAPPRQGSISAAARSLSRQSTGRSCC